MKDSERLQAAWNELQEPGKWTKGAFARDSSGRTVFMGDPSACSWCSLGVAVRYQAPSKYLRQALRVGSVGRVNDNAESVQDLAPMWERAINLAKEYENANNTTNV